MPINIQIPEKLAGFVYPKRYNVAYGGRGAAKSHTIAQLLLAKGAGSPRRILCAREVQRSIRDSVHALLSDKIKELGLEDFYEPLNTEIRGINGTEFLFAGLLGHTIQSIKSYEGIDDCWVEEAQTVSKNSWAILIPTIRKAGSQFYVSFNPELESDDTYQRFVETPPPDSQVVEINYLDNPWFPSELEKERLYAQKTMPKDEYEHIWLGRPRLVVAGAIFPGEMREMVGANRITRVPYDPRFEVHTFWDLGWNDKLTVIMVQKTHPSALNVIDYYEDSHKKYSEVVAELDKLGYRWGVDWLPHDGEQHHPTSGESAKTMLRKLGRRSVRVIPRGDPEERIRQARMVFPRVSIDSGDRKCDTGYRGGKRLVTCLKTYKRGIPESTGEPGRPVHDESSHAADAWGNMCLMADKIVNSGDVRPPRSLAPRRQLDRGMGALG